MAEGRSLGSAWSSRQQSRHLSPARASVFAMARPVSHASLSPARDWWWIFDPRLSLRARAALSVMVAAGAFTLLTMWLGGRSLQRSLEQQAAQYFEFLAVQVGDKIDRTLYERYRELQLVASIDAVRQASVGQGDANPALNALIANSPDSGWAGLIGLNGRIVASTLPALVNTDVSDRPWFRNAQERPFAGGLRDSPELARTLGATDNDSTRFFDLAVPVAAPNGRPGGVLAAHLRWDWAKNAQLSVVAEPALRERMAVTIYSGPNDIVLDSESLGWSIPPSVPSLPEARRFRGALIESTPEGAKFFTGYARSRGFRDYRGLGWITVVRQPLERVFAPVVDLRRTLFGWGLAFTSVLTLGTWVIAGRNARRLNSMGAAAERLREGDVLTVLPRPHSNDEYGRMCGSVGALVEELRAQQERPK